jgi:hypothetical protein
VQRVYGSWNSAKAQCELEPRKNSIPRYTLNVVLDALTAWVEKHGTLPSYDSVRAPVRIPALPSMPTILKALDTDSYPGAMRRAAALLNIYGGRYGLPEKKQGAA